MNLYFIILTKCLMMSMAVVEAQVVLVLDEIEAIQRVNMYRSFHGSPAIQHNNTLAKAMQGWADQIAQKDLFIHSKMPYGENLALARLQSCSNATYNVTTQVLQAIDAWYNEEKIYNYSRPSYSASTGHFTQLVWKRTSFVGIAVSLQPHPSCKLYIGMLFDPPGNYVSMMRLNVFPRVPSR